MSNFEKGQKLRVDVFLNFDPKNSHHIDFAEKLLKMHEQEQNQRAWAALDGWYAKLRSGKFKVQHAEPSGALRKLFLTTNGLMRQNQITQLSKL